MMIQKKIKIELTNAYPQDLISLDSYRTMIQKIISEESIPVTTIHIILVDDEYLSSLHKQFLKKDIYTDVMTFSMDEKEETEGEIYISMDRAKENAVKFKVEPREEIARLIIHGLLHLKGYDDNDKTAKENMQQLEDLFLLKYWESKVD